MTTKIDLNCDMGESFGMHKMGFDEEVIKHVSSANVACGAGDPTWMRHTVALAEAHGVAVGAHPTRATRTLSGSDGGRWTFRRTR